MNDDIITGSVQTPGQWEAGSVTADKLDPPPLGSEEILALRQMLASYDELVKRVEFLEGLHPSWKAPDLPPNSYFRPMLRPDEG